MTQTAKRRALNPLLLLPGAAFWTLLIIGVTTGDQLVISLAVGALALTLTILITRKARLASRDRHERRRIWRDGVEALARVVSIGTRGGGINDHPMVDFELDVTVPGRPAYRVSTQAIISMLAIPRVQPGCQLAVRIDPAASDRLVVDAALTPYGY